MAVVNYYTFQEDSGDKHNNKISKSLDPANKEHPLFNFESDFFEKLHSIKPPDLGLAVPYISLKVINKQGKVVKDLNVDFFIKGMDEKKLEQSLRNSDRPVMSLKSLKLQTSNASGYLYYTNVFLQLVIHAPTFLSDSIIVALMVPHTPLELEYGWKTPANINHPLELQTERLRFQVVTYNLNTDETNQITLQVRGMAFNDLFNNLYVGDEEGLSNSDVVSPEVSNGLQNQAKQRDQAIEYVENSEQQVHNYDIVRNMAVGYANAERRVRKSIEQKFSANNKKLKTLDKKITANTVSLHDVVYTMCNGTFLSFLKNAMPDVEEFRIYYGNTNKFAGSFANKSLAEFPVEMKQYDSMIKEIVRSGQKVPTVKVFLESLIRTFVENPKIWTKDLKKDVTFMKPDIVLNFTNRPVKKGNSYKMVLELQIFDVKANLPPTTSRLPRGSASPEEAKKEVLKGSGLSVLELGHANSFIKKINLSQISDSAMKAVFITRKNEDKNEGDRTTKTQIKDVQTASLSPLTLPLRGTMTVLGHREWKPFRSFYLTSGIFLVDAVYRILEVNHNLSAEGYTTDITFMYN